MRCRHAANDSRCAELGFSSVLSHLLSPSLTFPGARSLVFRACSLTFSHLLLPSQVRGAWLPKRTRGGERVGGGEDGHGALARLRAGHAEALAAQHADLLVLSLGMAEWEA